MRRVNPSKQRKMVPLWLRRLGLVKLEVQGFCWPLTVGEGFRQVAALSGIALRALEQEVRMAHPGADAREIQRGVRMLLARMTLADVQRIAFWKKERARFFRG